MKKKLRLSPIKLTPDDHALIVYISGYGSYSTLHLKDGKTHLHPDPLIRYAERLAHFIRIHKHYLINPSFVQAVTQLDADHSFVMMQSGEKLPIARRRLPLVRKTLHAALAQRESIIRVSNRTVK